MNPLAVRLAVTIVLIAGMWEAVRKAEADRLLHSSSMDGFEAARRLDPLDIRPLLALAESAPSDKERVAALEQAARLSPFDDLVQQRLGLAEEMAGRFPEAEAHLLRTADMSRKYEPRWALANFYFRRGRREEFWRWARESLAIAWGDPRPVFDLCWRLEPSAAGLERAIPERRGIRLAMADYLLAHGDAVGAARVAVPLASGVEAREQPAMASLAGGLLARYDIASAHVLWSALKDPKLREASDFWWHGPLAKRGLDGWRIELDGRQPEQCLLVSRAVKTVTSTRYRLRWDLESRLGSPSGPLRTSGTRWRVARWSAQRELLAESEELAVDGRGGGTLEFTAPPGGGVEVALQYRRPLGSMRAEGSVLVVSADVEPVE